MDGNNSRRIDRLEAVLRTAHAGRAAPPDSPGLADSVLAAIKASPDAKAPSGQSPATRVDRLESTLRAAHARRAQPPLAPDLADSVLAALKAGPARQADAADHDAPVDRLETVLRAAHAARRTPALDPELAASVVAAIKAEDGQAQTAQDNGLLWRMAAGAGLLAAATLIFALTLGSGQDGELARLLFYDPSGQVLVSLFGV